MACQEAEVGRKAGQQWDSIAHPLGSLGLLEEAVIKIAKLKCQSSFTLDRKALFVFCADNGVVCRGVSQCDSSVTASVAIALSEGRSTVNPMAEIAGCEVVPVDLGILDFPGHIGVRSCRVRNSTADISAGPAMSREECLEAIRIGVRFAEEYAAKGYDIIAAGEMGIGNTTSATAVASVLLSMNPEILAGRGAGLSDLAFIRKKEIIAEAIAKNRPDPTDPVDILSKLGGLDIAAMCGLFLGGSANRIPVLIDGMISSVAALCAVRLCPEAKGAILASHLSAEPCGEILLKELGLVPFLRAGLRLGEGSGAVAVMPLLDMALAVYNSTQTFLRLGIEPYKPL